MEQITGFAAGRYVLADMDHFLYVKRRSEGQIVYLQCRESTCFGSVKWHQIENTIALKSPHNHAPIEEDYQELLFRQSLRHRASTEDTPLKSIFLQEQQSNQVGSNRLTYADISRLMHRARQSGTSHKKTELKK